MIALICLIGILIIFFLGYNLGVYHTKRDNKRNAR